MTEHAAPTRTDWAKVAAVATAAAPVVLMVLLAATALRGAWPPAPWNLDLVLAVPALAVAAWAAITRRRLPRAAATGAVMLAVAVPAAWALFSASWDALGLVFRLAIWGHAAAVVAWRADAYPPVQMVGGLLAVWWMGMLAWGLVDQVVARV